MSAAPKKDPAAVEAEVREKIHLEILKRTGAYHANDHVLLPSDAGVREQFLGARRQCFLLCEVCRPRFLALAEVRVAPREELVARVAESLPDVVDDDLAVS